MVNRKASGSLFSTAGTTTSEKVLSSTLSAFRAQECISHLNISLSLNTEGKLSRSYTRLMAISWPYCFFKASTGALLFTEVSENSKIVDLAGSRTKLCRYANLSTVVRPLLFSMGLSNEFQNSCHSFSLL